MKKSNRREFLRDGFTAAAGFGAALGLGLHASKTVRAAQKTRGAASGDLDELRRKLEGDLLLPKDEGYDDASAPANGRYNGIRPIAVALCNNEKDVITCV